MVGSDAHGSSVLLALEDQWGEEFFNLDHILVILLLHWYGAVERVVAVIIGGVRKAEIISNAEKDVTPSTCGVEEYRRQTVRE